MENLKSLFENFAWYWQMMQVAISGFPKIFVAIVLAATILEVFLFFSIVQDYIQNRKEDKKWKNSISGRRQINQSQRQKHQ